MQFSPSWEANISSLEQKLFASYGMVFPKIRHLHLSWVRLIQFTPSHPILMLSSHLSLDLPRVFFLLCSPAMTPYTVFFPYVIHILHIFSSFIWSPTKYLARRRLQTKSPLIKKSLPGPVASSLWGPNIFLDAHFWIILAYVLPSMSEAKFHTHRNKTANYSSERIKIFAFR